MTGRMRLTCRYCIHAGVIIAPLDESIPMKKYCPSPFLFNHPNPEKCPNFVLDKERWHRDHLPRGKVLKVIAHPSGEKELILECPECRNTGTIFGCRDFTALGLDQFLCRKCRTEFRA